MTQGFSKSIEKALKNRVKLLEVFQKEKTDCYRLFNGELEGISGFVVERYGPLLVFQWHEGKCGLDISAMESIAQFYGSSLGIKSVYLKRFISDRSTTTADESYYLNRPLWGAESEPSIVCYEKGMKIEIHPYEGFSTGIFLDQRNNREFLRLNFKNKEVLNCFAYTCAFSLACALGENTITSVDLSKKYLDWGKRNFILNGIPPEKHGFYAVDVFEQFKKTKKLGKTYDLIILDPPSFSRNQSGKVFSVKKDMKALVSESCDILNSCGTIFVSSNLATWGSSELKKLVQEVLKEKRIKVDWVQLPPEPSDLFNVEASLAACAFRKCF
jgi:23S rRNA (cytosine1962-C5)-methyltransferase